MIIVAPQNRGACLSLIYFILFEQILAWTGRNVPKWIYTFLSCSSVGVMLSSEDPGTYYPKWCSRPLISTEEQNSEGNYPISAELINTRNVGHTHCLMCCACHVPTKQLPRVAKLPESRAAPKKSSHLETHFHWQFGQVGHSLKKKP